MTRWNLTKILFVWWLSLLAGDRSERDSAAKAISCEVDICERNTRRYLAAVEAEIAARKEVHP